MVNELRSTLTETRQQIRNAIAGPSPQQQTAVALFPSNQPVDPCQAELNTLGTLLQEYDAFMDSWEPRLIAAMELLECCRIAYPSQTPP